MDQSEIQVRLTNALDRNRNQRQINVLLAQLRQLLNAEITAAKNDIETMASASRQRIEQSRPALESPREQTKK